MVFSSTNTAVLLDAVAGALLLARTCFVSQNAVSPQALVNGRRTIETPLQLVYGRDSKKSSSFVPGPDGGGDVWCQGREEGERERSRGPVLVSGHKKAGRQDLHINVGRL